MNRPLVSIVVPVFNAQMYISEALDSLLAQTYTNIEIIIGNDGSTDTSMEKARQFPDPRIRIIDLPHRGIASTLNSCIRLASGAFIARADADDISHRKRIERQVTYLLENPHVDLVFSKAYRWKRTELAEDRWSPNSSQELYQRIFRCCCLCHPTALGKRDLFLKHEYSVWQKWEDYHLWLRLVSHGTSIAVVPEHLYFLRRGHNTNLSHCGLVKLRLGDFMAQASSLATCIVQLWQNDLFIAASKGLLETLKELSRFLRRHLSCQVNRVISRFRASAAPTIKHIPR